MSELQPHDALFKETFSSPTNAASHLRAFLPPPLAERIDWTSLQAESTEFLVHHLETVQSDVLLSGRIDGRRGFVYVLYEHQSTPDRLMAFRMQEYVTCIQRRHLRDHPDARGTPAVIPCVVYHGPAPWRAPTNCLDLVDLSEDSRAELRAHLPSMTFLLDDLSAASFEEIAGRPVIPSVRLVLLAFRVLPRTTEPEAELERLAGTLAEVVRDDADSRLPETFLCYFFTVADPDPQATKAIMRRELGPPGEEAYMYASKKLTKKAWAEGRAETLLYMLSIRFGTVPEGVAARVRGARIEELDVWCSRLFRAERLEDVFV